MGCSRLESVDKTSWSPPGSGRAAGAPGPGCQAVPTQDQQCRNGGAPVPAFNGISIVPLSLIRLSEGHSII